MEPGRILVELLAAAVAVVGIGLLVAGTYFGGVGLDPLLGGLLTALAGFALFAVGTAVLLRRDSELSDRIAAFLKDLLMGT